MIDILLLRLARWILRERNVPRSRIISRADNNRLYGMAEQIDAIIHRMKNKYE
jgi:hypothetical protein